MVDRGFDKFEYRENILRVCSIVLRSDRGVWTLLYDEVG